MPAKRCPSGYHLDRSGRCVPNVGRECPPGFHKNAAGKCVRNVGQQPVKPPPPKGPTPVVPPGPTPTPGPGPNPDPDEDLLEDPYDYWTLLSQIVGGSWSQMTQGPPGQGGPYQGPEAEAEGDYGAYVHQLLNVSPSGNLFGDLIDKAITEAWSPERFIAALYGSEPFKLLFPGLVRPDGSLRMTPGEYRSLGDTYRDIASDYGIALNDYRVGLLVSGNVSPEEFNIRAQAIQNVRNNPGLLDAYNEQLRQYGYAPLDAQGFMRFVAGAGSPDYYDIYEAANLSNTQGITLSFGEAAEVARAVGAPGTPVDIQQIVQQLRLMKADIGPELSAAGITDADILKLEGGVDPRGIAPTVASIINQRRAQGTYVPGRQARRGTAGGIAFEQEQAPSYG